MIRRSLLLSLPAALLAVLLASCDTTRKATSETAPAPASTALPLFDTFGDLHRDVGTRVPAAQRYFDQGLRMAYGFNHEAAGRAFAEAARLDPQCAMCVWGQALVLGPNINLPMDAALAKDATALAARAASLTGAAKPADRALIQALQARYADPAPEDRKPLDRAYADAMARVVEQYPDDDDAATLYAEALMDSRPGRTGKRTAHRRSSRRACSANSNACWRATRATSARCTTTSTPPRPRPNRSAPNATPTRWRRWRPARAIWCTCPRTPTSASAATTTRL